MSMVFKTKLAHRNNYGSKRNVNTIKYIVLHYTSNDGDTDEANANYFSQDLKANGKPVASAHYFVDDDSYTQSVPDDYVAWAVGGSKWNNNGGRLYGIANNSNSISIEMCDTKKDGTVKATPQTIANTIELTKMLMDKYNIPVSNVIRHYDVNGKTCPMYWVNDTVWKVEFLDKLREFSPVYNGIDYSPVFDVDYYADNNPDVKKAYGNNKELLFKHFIKHGFREKGRKTHPKFNIDVYKNDVTNGDLNILLYNHYCKHGKNENRKTI